jgi:hypothetical protein
MSEKLFDMSVVLPIFNGGELFMDAIYSIENSKIPFSNVFISFNGESDLDYQRFLTASSKGNFKNSFVLFQTNKDLDAVEHANFFLKQLQKILTDNSTILMLAHDDRIIPPKIDEFISLLRNNDLDSTIFFPSYHCCMSDNYQEIIKIIENNESLPTENFFFRSLNENISTNMSGMILPFHALLASNRAMNKAKSRGARFEHITCISPGIKNIHFHNKLSMLIGERPDSEGKMLSYRDHRIAAFNYIWSFLKNKQLKTIRKMPMYFYCLAKNWVGYLIYK